MGEMPKIDCVTIARAPEILGARPQRWQLACQSSEDRVPGWAYETL